MGQEVAAVDDVSKKEFEASLSLLHMMQRPSGSSSGTATAASCQKKPTKKRAGSAAAAQGRAPKKAKMIISGGVDKGVLLLAAASQVHPRHDGQAADNDAEDVEEEEEEADVDDDGASSGLPRGSPRRNSQLTSLSHELSIDDLRHHFGKPIVEVAKEFGICTTFLKKICRRLGIKRWPHRQIRSLTRTIEMLYQAELNATCLAEKMKYASQIAHVKAKMSAVITDPDANGKLERVKKSVLNRSNGGSPSVKKTAAAASRGASSASPQAAAVLPPAATAAAVVGPFFQANLLHAVAAAAAASASEAVASTATQEPVVLQHSVATTEAEATAAAALLYSSTSPRLTIAAIDTASLPAVVLAGGSDAPILPVVTPKASSTPAGSASKDTTPPSGLRISPVNRKLLAVTKSESRVRSSSLGSLQDLDEGDSGAPCPEKALGVAMVS